MEQHFGYDFSRVRVHTGAAAEQSARAVNAQAYTLGCDVVFGEGSFSPNSMSGRYLLAHELAHVVQQSGTEGTLGLQRETGAGSGAARRSSPWKTRGRTCGRATRENVDFPNTRISRVDVDLTAQQLSLSWINPTGLSLPSGPFGISAGAGRCCLNCNDEATSQARGSLCTPKGNWRVHNKGCVLSTATWARNPTYFSRAGIAIHAGPRPGYPASHGCVRTTEEASEIIHDNSVFSSAYGPDEATGRAERRTEIVVSGTWAGRRCYPSASSDTSVARSRRCATTGPGSGSGSRSERGSASEPRSMTEETPMTEMITAELDEPVDGPGPT
jgi:hypothetical protein